MLYNFPVRPQNEWLMAQGSGPMTHGSGLRAQGSWLMAQGSGLRAHGSGPSLKNLQNFKPPKTHFLRFSFSGKMYLFSLGSSGRRPFGGSPGGVPGGSQGPPGNGGGLVALGASKSLHGSDTFTFIGEHQGE